MSNTFVINGKTYQSLEEMPPDVRAQWDAMQNVFADRNQNGLPDVMDNLAASGATMMQSSTIVYQGKTYSSPDDLPPEGRAAYDTGMNKLADVSRGEMPDIVQDASYPAPIVVTTRASSNAPGNALPPAGTSSTNLGPIIVLAIVCIGLVIIVGILLFLVLNKTR